MKISHPHFQFIILLCTAIFSVSIINCEKKSKDISNNKLTSKKNTNLDYIKTPIIFVHGRGMAPSTFEYLINYLQKKGYPSNFLAAINLEPNDGPNIDAAENQITPFVENVINEINSSLKMDGMEEFIKEKIDIVAHSMGSVSSRWYIARIKPEKVRIWISLAGPNHGSNVQCPGTPGSGKRELCPAFARNEQESFIQFHLNGGLSADIDETPFGVGRDAQGVESVPPDSLREICYVTIRTENDKWIEPVSSVILDGTGGCNLEIPPDIPAVEIPEGNILMLNNVGHDEMLQDQMVFQLIYKILN